LPDPGDAIPYVKAMWFYAPGVALAARRDFGGATAAANQIEELDAVMGPALNERLMWLSPDR